MRIGNIIPQKIKFLSQYIIYAVNTGNTCALRTFFQEIILAITKMNCQVIGGFLIEIETKLACLFHLFLCYRNGWAICNKLANSSFYFDKKSVSEVNRKWTRSRKCTGSGPEWTGSGPEMYWKLTVNWPGADREWTRLPKELWFWKIDETTKRLLGSRAF